MTRAWREAGFAADFVEAHAQLAYGGEQDRNGLVKL
jgi:hypothetical protein